MRVGAVPALRVATAVAAVVVNKPGGKLTVITPLVAVVNGLMVPIVKVTVEIVEAVRGMRAAGAIVKLGLVITPPSDTAACMVDAKSYGVLMENPPQEAATGAPDLKLLAEVDVRVTVSAAAVMTACAAMVIVVNEATLTAPVKLPVAVAVPTK